MSETQDKLQAKFPAHEVKCRMGATTGDKTKGMPLFYIDARAVQGRLDEVFGWDGWTVAYREIGTKGVLCRLCVKVEAVEGWVAKEDGADITDIEPTKGGISDALRRVAASGFGIGRYLYEVKADWVPIVQHGNSYRFASRPQLPASALPGGAVPQAQPQPKTVMGHDNDSPVWTPDQSPQDAAQPEQPTNVFDEALKVAQSTPQPAPAATPPEPQQVASAMTFPLTYTKHPEDGSKIDIPDIPHYREAVAYYAQNPSEVTKCFVCGKDNWDNRAKGGSVAFKCQENKWNRDTSTSSGCVGAMWNNDYVKACAKAKNQSAAGAPASETLDFPDDSIPF